jgi:hypothetical protein
VIVIAAAVPTSHFEQCLVPYCPFLGNQLSKGVFLVMISSLCFGGEMGNIGSYAGIALLITGCGYIVLTLVQSPRKEFRTEKVFFEDSTYEPPQYPAN